MSSKRCEFVVLERDPYSGDVEELAVGLSPAEIRAQLESLEGDR